MQQVGDRVDVTLRVENRTGGDVQNLLPADPLLQIEAGTQFTLGTRSSPTAYSIVRSGAVVAFRWRGSFDSAGVVGISASASALGAGSSALETLPTDCGTASR